MNDQAPDEPQDDAEVDMAAVQLLVPQLDAAQSAAATAARAAGGVEAGQVTVLDPPHISLGYPWMRPPSVTAVERIAGRLLPITVALGAVAAFPPDARGRRTLHVPVLDGGLLQDLAAQLGWTGVITPHCSLVRSRSSAALDRAQATAIDHVPTTVRLTCLEVTARIDGRWQHLQRWDADGHGDDTSGPPPAGPWGSRTHGTRDRLAP